MHDPSRWTEIPYLSIPLEHVLSGAAGGFSHSLVTGRIAFREAGRAILIGALVSGYGTQASTSLLCKWLMSVGYKAGGLDDIVGFTLGLCGITVTETLIVIAQKVKEHYGRQN